ncbi:MAG TPA: hypothetical protein VGO00_23820 [Kofleriaceae bacterium]|jgi:hypothetical protein|nr:hypothetical protein [Kofleriaceae bacterium]
MRPAWPYILGIVGGLIVHVGADAYLYAAVAESASSTVSAVIASGFGIGALLVGIGWMGLFKQRQAGIGPILGSFVITLAVVYVRFGSPENVDVAAVLLLLSFVLFGLGHAVTRGISGTRIFGAIAAIAGTIQIIAISAHWKVDRGVAQILDFASVGSLALLGLSLAVTLPGLRRAPITAEQHIDGRLD